MELEPLPKLLQRLRDERRMTQRDLAIDAGFSTEVISKIESGRGGWAPRTARWVLKALAKKYPVTEREAHDFLVQSEVTISIAGRLPADEFIELAEQGMIRGIGKGVREEHPTSRGRELDHLIATVGEDAAIRALRSLADILGRANEPALPNAAELNIIAPPVQRLTPEGVPYVEEVIRTVAPAPPSPPSAAGEVSSAKHSRRKRG